jgi:SAM-dependent methyltransferase
MTVTGQGSCCCPICQSESGHYIAAPGWGEMRICLSCGFVFANPMVSPDPPTELFARAYLGREDRAEMSDFINRLLFYEDTKRAGVKIEKIVAPLIHRPVISFLKTNVPRGSCVFDIGCGVGFFLKAVRQAGYNAFGLEVAKPAVELLQKEGYPVWNGTVETVPAGWVEPQVCTVFFVLHHIPDPVAFLRTIRRKFPEAILVLSQYRISGPEDIEDRHAGRSLPPRTLSWWKESTLRLAMEKAGYLVEISEQEYSGIYVPGRVYLALRKHAIVAMPWLIRAFYVARPLLLWTRTEEKKSRTLLAIGRPI